MHKNITPVLINLTAEVAESCTDFLRDENEMEKYPGTIFMNILNVRIKEGNFFISLIAVSWINLAMYSIFISTGAKQIPNYFAFANDFLRAGTKFCKIATSKLD